MSLIIHKTDSAKTIRKAILKASRQSTKRPVDIDKYFGKVNFGMDGLKYQKKVRNEWE